MRLDVRACWAHIGTAGHGTLGTVHPDRGVDAVPVVFVVVDGQVVVPIDTVKPKAGRRLQRLANVEADARVVLLVDRYDEDWSRLWWVRVHAEAVEIDPSPGHLAALASAFPAYAEPSSVTGVLLLTPTEVTGWSAT
ncbi:MAG: pyridoxamine 5'-phosphate oxidase family protein [Acidimicrobiales bacterium]